MKTRLIFGTLLISLLLWASPAYADICWLDDDEPCNEDMFDINIMAHVGYAHPGLQALNGPLTDRGYQGVNENMFLGGGGFQFIINSFLSELEFDALLTAPTANDEFQTWLTAGTFMLNFGYEFKPTRDISLSPILGIGMGFADLTFSRRNLFLSFDEFLDNPGQQGEISNLMLMFNAGLNINYKLRFGPNWGMNLGVRGGYLWTPIASNWWQLNDVLRSDDDVSRTVALSNGPAIALSGPYLKFMVGF